MKFCVRCIFALLCLSAHCEGHVTAPPVPEGPFEDPIEGVIESDCAYFLSVCAIFQNEGRFLKEWIEYHHMLGVEHFILYNNNSDDEYLTVLQPYIQRGLVELIDWPSPVQEDWTPYQVKAYEDCIQRSIGQTVWLAVIDIDEYIVPVDRPNLTVFLEEFKPRKKVGGIRMSWQCYGTSGCAKIPDDKLMIECLTWKGNETHGWNRHVKSICKPHIVKRYCVHAAHYKPGYFDIMPGNGGPLPHPLIQLKRIRVNHYWTRDEDFFFNAKIPRRARCEGHLYTQEEIDDLLQSFHKVEDPIMKKFIPKLRKRVFKK